MSEPSGRPMTGVSRSGLAQAALDLVQEDGLDALTMRTLADRTGVKAASLYWHVRDREELLELMADALLARAVAPARSQDWRRQSLALCTAAGAAVTAQRDGDRILFAVPAALRRSAVYTRLVSAITEAGADEGIAREVAAMLLAYTVTQPPARFGEAPPPPAKPLTLAVDSGSRGVVVHAGGPMETLFRIPSDRSAAAPAVLRDERLVIRRLRGGGRGEIEINAAHPWRVQVQGPTWNTLLDLRGLDLREIHLDSSATKVECLLPHPRGIVPIHIPSGVVKVWLRRIPGTPVVAHISSGAVQVRLDAYHSRVAIGDGHWETPGAANMPDRYELQISSGAVRVTLDDSAADEPTPAAGPSVASDAALASVIGTVLDGVAMTTSSARHGTAGRTVEPG